MTSTVALHERPARLRERWELLGRAAARTPKPHSTGLLLLRLVVGVTFLVHGIDKLADLAAAERMFASLDVPLPAVMAPFVGLTETVGGALLILGLGTPLVGVALAVDMLVALLTAHIDQGFFAAEGGMELVLLLGGASLALAIAGPGRFSVDAATSRVPA